eukprot:gene17569-23892_t
MAINRATNERSWSHEREFDQPSARIIAGSGFQAAPPFHCLRLPAPCYSYSRKQLSSRARASSRRLLSNNLEDAIKIDHRHLLAPLVGFTKLEFTLPSCMPMAGTTCSLNNAYLVEAMGDLNASELSIPQL